MVVRSPAVRLLPQLAFLLFYVMLLLVTAFNAHARVPQWAFVDLGTMNGGNFTTASALTNRGDVAGGAVSPVQDQGGLTGVPHVYLWRNGEMTDLGAPDREGFFLNDMNESGTIVATGLTTGGLVWRDGQWTQLAPDISPDAINNSGVIAGKRGFGVNTEAFVYTGSALLGLGTFGGKTSYAFAVNDAGQVVGGSTDAQEHSHAFLWKDGIMTDLGTFNGENTAAVDINNNGLILGTTEDHATSRRIVFTWDGSVMHTILVSRDQMTFYPRKLNDRGDVVGQMGTNTALLGWLYSDGQLTILDEIPEVILAGFHELNPAQINNRGWIVGTCKNASGAYRGFLLIKRLLK